MAIAELESQRSSEIIFRGRTTMRTLLEMGGKEDRAGLADILFDFRALDNGDHFLFVAAFPQSATLSHTSFIRVLNEARPRPTGRYSWDDIVSDWDILLPEVQSENPHKRDLYRMHSLVDPNFVEFEENHFPLFWRAINAFSEERARSFLTERAQEEISCVKGDAPYRRGGLVIEHLGNNRFKAQVGTHYILVEKQSGGIRIIEDHVDESANVGIVPLVLWKRDKKTGEASYSCERVDEKHDTLLGQIVVACYCDEVRKKLPKKLPFPITSRVLSDLQNSDPVLFKRIINLFLVGKEQYMQDAQMPTFTRRYARRFLDEGLVIARLEELAGVPRIRPRAFSDSFPFSNVRR